jgi:hydrogenase maturation factor
MHDATEGGLVATLNEVADASEVGFKVEMGKIPVSKEAWSLGAHFKLAVPQVLAMSSTGTILAAVNPEDKVKVEEALRRNGIPASFLGSFTKNKDRILSKSDGDTAFPHVADDPYSQILALQV